MTSEGMVRVVSAPCDQCPWKGGLELRPGRLRDLRKTVRQQGGTFTCHKTMFNDRLIAGPDGSAAVCAGWLAIGDVPSLLQVAYRLGWVEEVEPL